MHRLALLAPRDHADSPQRLFHRGVRFHRDELGRHQAARRVRIEAAQLLCLAPRLVGHLVDDLFGALLVQLLEHVRPLVRIHLRDECGRLLRRHRLKHLGAELLVEILEHLGRAILRQGRQEHRHQVERHRLGDVGEIGGVQLLGLRRDLRRRFLEQRDDVGSEESADRTLLGLPLYGMSWPVSGHGDGRTQD